MIHNATNLQNTREELQLLKASSRRKEHGLQETPHRSLTLVENVNALVSRIVKLNGKISDIRREHKLQNRPLTRDRTRVLRCFRCESYDHETHQCCNWNTSPLNNEDLKTTFYTLKRKKKGHGEN